MTSDKDVYAKIKEHPKGAVRLFKVMMRLEFALKECKFCKKKKKAEVDWDEFAERRLGTEFFEAVKDSGKAQVLIDSPPKHQIVSCDGGFEWEEPGSVSDILGLIGALRRVRNNLFHGGKSADTDRKRNDDLVCNALFVIDTILQKHSDVRCSFKNG